MQYYYYRGIMKDAKKILQKTSMDHVDGFVQRAESLNCVFTPAYYYYFGYNHALGYRLVYK